MKDAKSLCTAPNLLRFDMEKSFDETFYVELIQSTGGRVVLDWWLASGMFDIKKVSVDAQRKYRQRQDLLWEIDNVSADTKIINEWESMFGKEM